MNTIDVVIPVHNHSYWLAACLESLTEEVTECIDTVYVVDDRSDNIESENIILITKSHPKCIYIKNNASSGGFGYACNLGASHSSAELIVFLNTDCFVTSGVFEKLRDSFKLEEKLALVCPVSNNSPELTMPMQSGYSYMDMSELIGDFGDGQKTVYLREACTIVGNCLMVRSDFFKSQNGFSEEWGIGYGEETDLQMKAVATGMLGMVRLDAYVYHYGGGTFNTNEGIEAHRLKNHALFMGKWAPEYKKLKGRAGSSNYINELSLYSSKKLKKVIQYDIIFYLPGLKQGIGGVHAVVALCNEFIKNGLSCNIALVGISASDHLPYFKEPILFSPLYYSSEREFLNDDYIYPKIVFSTIWNSAFIVKEFCTKKKARHIQFVQGYEGYFENGTNYKLAVDSLKCSSDVVTTSSWLVSMIARHVENPCKIKKLPLYVNKNIFYSNNISILKSRIYDICFVFRESADKGQWLAREVLSRCAMNKELKVLVLAAKPYFNDIISSNIEVEDIVMLPLSQYEIAKKFRQSKVYVDFSMHEGFGLMGLEAGLCGCRLVVSDSGGVSDYVCAENGVVIESYSNPDFYINAILGELKSEDSKTHYSNQINAWIDYLASVMNTVDNELEVNEAIKNKEAFIMFTAVKYPRKIRFNDLLLREIYCLYKKIKKYLPARLHKAIKILVKGD